MNIESITPKLNYLNDTKELIKEALIEKGIEVSDTDTFRSYAEKISEIETGGGKATLPAGTVLSFYDIPASESPTGKAENVTDEMLDTFFDNVDTSNMSLGHINFQNTFNNSGCTHITTVPLFDTSNIIDFSSMFKNCTSLQNVPVYNSSSVMYMSDMFYGCPNLTDESLNNILLMCINATDSLDDDLVLYTIISPDDYSQSRIQALPAYQDFINAGWALESSSGE
jgi:hypothetical protein